MALFVRQFLSRQLARLLTIAVASICLIVLAGCGQSGSSKVESAAAPLAPPKIQLGKVACLTTQWYPDTAANEDETENKILRELVRQGVLIAAREELGLATRDETLEEPFPKPTSLSQLPANGTEAVQQPAEDQSRVDPLSVWLEVDPSGTWEACLYGAGAVLENPVWQHHGELKFDKKTIYSELAEQMDSACAEIAAQMREAGATGRPVELNGDNRPPAEIESQLESMDFVSQFAAVRAAHLAMRAKGASPAWLGVLVRGYANLAMLTDHTWSSQSEAFAVRSLLYAERMCRIDGTSALAQWHRAYASAIIGAHAGAIEQLDAIAAHTETSGDKLPPWTLIIEPYVKFESAELNQVAADHPELKQTVALLNWNQYRSYMHGRWIYEQGLETAQECPEAYGVYSVMANWNSLRTKRLGSSMGLAAFGGRLPVHLLTLADLPATAREYGGAANGWLATVFGSRRKESLSDRPIKMSQAPARRRTTNRRPANAPGQFSRV